MPSAASLAAAALVVLMVMTPRVAAFGPWPASDVIPTPDPAWVAQFSGGASPIPDVRTCTSANAWGLTYDDGPSGETGRVLDALAAVGAKATFFVVGSRVAENPDGLRRAFQAGHQIASHTWSHTVMTRLTDAQIIAELMWSGKIIEDVTGQFPRFFRPPEGEIDDRVRRIAAAMGLRAVLWDHDTLDWKTQSGELTSAAVTARIDAWIREKPAGPLSLEHDLYASTVAIAVDVVHKVHGARYAIQPVAQCAGQGAFYQPNPARASGVRLRRRDEGVGPGGGQAIPTSAPSLRRPAAPPASASAALALPVEAMARSDTHGAGAHLDSGIPPVQSLASSGAARRPAARPLGLGLMGATLVLLRLAMGFI